MHAHVVANQCLVPYIDGYADNRVTGLAIFNDAFEPDTHKVG